MLRATGSRLPHVAVGEEVVGLQVLVVGRLRPELGVSGLHEGVPVVDVRHPDAVQDSLAEAAGRERAVLVLCALDEAPEVRRQLALVDVALPDVRTLLEPVDGTPLAVGAVATLVHDAADRGAAHQLAVLDALRARSWSAVWLPSVAGLHRPRPALAQHVRSWLGGPGFLAVHGPEPRVLACPGTALPSVEGPAPGGVLMAADAGAPDWVVASAAAALGSASTVDCTSWRDPRDAYGVARCAELLVVPADLDDPATVPDTAAECAGCGRRQPRRVCPFCRMLAPTDELQGADA